MSPKAEGVFVEVPRVILQIKKGICENPPEA